MNRTIRALSRGLLALAVPILGATLVASPASAAAQYALTPSVYDEVKIETGGGTIGELAVERATSFAATVNFTFTVDLAAFAGKVTLSGNGCTGVGTVYTCQYRYKWTTTDANRVSLGYVGFDAAGDTVPASKKVTWRMTTNVSAAAETEQYLTVKQPGKLLSDAHKEISATPGSTVAVPLSVRNAGATPVVNPALRFTLNTSVAPARLPSNCRSKTVTSGVTYACFFGVTIPAGASYTLTLDLAVTAASTGADLSYSWEPYGRGDRAVWTPGTGPALTLSPTSVAPTGTTSYNSVAIRVS